MFRRPWRHLGLVSTVLATRVKRVRRAPVLAHSAKVSDLPPVRNWPDDGGAFVTLPQVYTEEPGRPGWRNSNLGMYRVQLGGGEYERDRQVAAENSRQPQDQVLSCIPRLKPV